MFRSRALQDVRVELARISVTLSAIVDLEARTRRLEKFMYGIPASILASGAAIVIAWMRHTS